MISIAELVASLEMGLIYGIVAVGIYLTFRVIDFPDLTCDGSFVTGAAASTIALKAGCNPLLALLIAMICGGMAGIFTGLLYSYLRVTNLLAGILVAFMLYSINLRLMVGVPNIALLDHLTVFSHFSPLFTIIAITGMVGATCSYLLMTDIGLAMRSIGHNPQLARIMGVRLTGMTLLGLTLSNALIGLGGGLFSQHQGFADVSLGIGTVIIGLASVMIGEKLLPFPSMWIRILACFVGSILYRLVIAVALHSEWLGLETSDLNLVTGGLVILVMWLSNRERQHAAN
jgi:putative ABC transport system permease protein